jgi:hypothetical protein
MNQNIFGVILFSFIVGTAIFVSEFFVKLPSPPSVDNEQPIIYQSKNRCGKTVYQSPIVSSLAKIKIKQSVLNLNTNQLNTSLEIERERPSVENIGVSYYFFVKDGKSTRFLSSETVTVKPDFNTHNKANELIISSYSWLDELNSKDNLYVIVEPSANGFRPSSSIPRFDDSMATPVLLMKGKN